MTNQLQAVRPRLNTAHEECRLTAIKAAICEETTRVCVEQHGDHLQAIVLTGSLARDEATVVDDGHYWSLLGDAEFLLVFDAHAALPPASARDFLRQQIEDALLHRRVCCHVTLSAIHPTYLRKLRPHIFAYELRVCGQVVWGEPQILSLIPSFSPSDIPLEDAWRLLCNRMIEALEVAEELADGPEMPSQCVLYRTVKLYLDMATSFLLFAGAYEPTYRQRAERLRILADRALLENGCPFPLGKFAERVAACTRSKLPGPDNGAMSATAVENRAGLAFWEEAVTYTGLLWRWELSRLTGTKVHLSNHALWERWRERQPLHQRLRGWLYVLRKQGWYRSWREWPRWGRRCLRASPRYWVYAAASELFFCVSWLVVLDGQRLGSAFDWEGLRRLLPVAQKGSLCERRPAWRQLASDIAFNYHQFLEGTRA